MCDVLRFSPHGILLLRSPTAFADASQCKPLARERRFDRMLGSRQWCRLVVAVTPCRHRRRGRLGPQVLSKVLGSWEYLLLGYALGSYRGEVNGMAALRGEWCGQHSRSTRRPQRLGVVATGWSTFCVAGECVHRVVHPSNLDSPCFQTSDPHAAEEALGVQSPDSSRRAVPMKPTFGNF